MGRVCALDNWPCRARNPRSPPSRSRSECRCPADSRRPDARSKNQRQDTHHKTRAAHTCVGTWRCWWHGARHCGAADETASGTRPSGSSASEEEEKGCRDAGLRRVVDDDRLAQVAPQDREVLHVVAIHHEARLTEQPKPDTQWRGFRSQPMATRVRDSWHRSSTCGARSAGDLG